MDKVEKALASFHNPYSCAQTIWATFSDEAPENLAAMREKSGGRAPENMCGALFAAIKILPENERENAVAEFEKKVGSCKCREIKTVHRVSCEDCVKFAATILKEKLK